MRLRPALAVRDAVAMVRQHTPARYHVRTSALSHAEIASDFAAYFAGVPANSLTRTEDVALYPAADGAGLPVLLGLYGDASRVRSWLPGLPRHTNRRSVGHLLSATRKPEVRTSPACQEVTTTDGVDLDTLPALRATPRDAGRYLTMGMVYAHDAHSGELALSVHRMLVLDSSRLTIWMVPGRQLRKLHEGTVHRDGQLPISINIGAPPAVMIASAVNSRFLSEGVTKLDVAGALAGEPIALAPAVSQPTLVLAESEIVLEGFLDTTVTDECVSGTAGTSLPEFLGYDGAARTDLPVVTVTAMTMRRSAVYQAVIGPGREQSVILGLAGALSAALSGDDGDWRMIRDLHFSAAGGGMLLLVVAVCKDSPEADLRLPHIARQLFSQHPFIKVIIFTDEDIDVTSMEDVFWAVTTRSNLGTDCTTLPGFSPLAMDPSQSKDWAAARGSDGASGRTFIDATTPYWLRDRVVRSYPAIVEER